MAPSLLGLTIGSYPALKRDGVFAVPDQASTNRKRWYHRGVAYGATKQIRSSDKKYRRAARKWQHQNDTGEIDDHMPTPEHLILQVKKKMIAEFQSSVYKGFSLEDKKFASEAVWAQISAGMDNEDYISVFKSFSKRHDIEEAYK